MTLYLLDYNNYATRKKKSEDSIEKYLSHRIGEPIENIAFNPNDGITTELTIPYAGYATSPVEPNYAILIEDNKIVSRWFIIELQRLRKGQYKATLRRDLLIDYNGEYMGAPCFIEKAMLFDSDPFIHNSEDMTFNQIKVKEILLKDPSQCAWIVGYINKNRGDTSQEISAEVNRLGVYKIYNSLADYPYYSQIQSGRYKSTLNISRYNVMIEDYSTSDKDGIAYMIAFDETGWYRWYQLESRLPQNERNIFQLQYDVRTETLEDAIRDVVNQWSKQMYTFYQEYSTTYNFATPSQTSTFLNTVPEVIKVIDTGERFNINRGNPVVSYETNKPANGSNLAITMANILKSPSRVIAANTFYAQINKFVDFNMSFQYYPVSKTPYEPFKYQMTLYGSNAVNGLLDAPYDMFAIPYPLEGTTSVCYTKISGVDFPIIIDAEAGMMIGNKIAEQLTEAGCYDIQLLPYCPIPELNTQYALIDVRDLEENKDFCYIRSVNPDDETNKICSICLFPTKSTFTRNLYEYYDQDTGNYQTYSSKITNKKIQSLTEFCRICSPNYNGQFEFSPAKNNGVDYYNIDCTYKPFSPYIHIAPNFKGLYGDDYNDARGLICGGDFSLPRTTDKWQEYEIQNKNYQNSFNRQIENMEISQKYARTSEIVNAIAGGAGGMISGATTGALVGGGIPGAVAGGVVGGAISAIGAVADININDKLRSEAIDYTKDMFGYSLENIKALPYALSRVSSFNANNKIFPVLEFYSATDEEKEALKNKIKYNGMTVMRFGKLNEYINLNYNLNYLKGRLVLHSGAGIDTHTANEIINEVYKGFYIENKPGGIEL